MSEVEPRGVFYRHVPERKLRAAYNKLFDKKQHYVENHFNALLIDLNSELENIAAELDRRRNVKGLK